MAISPTSCASVHAYNILRARVDLHGKAIKHGDEADTMTSGIQISVASPGVDDGNTDGFRDPGDPLVMVLGIGSTLAEAEGYNQIIDNGLENSYGANEYGQVVRCTRERQYHNTGQTPSKQTRFLIGGFYRFAIIENVGPFEDNPVGDPIPI